MVINGIKLNFNRLINKHKARRRIPLIVIKEDREYFIFPYTESTFMLTELSGEEDASYSIISYDDIVWLSDDEFELHGSKCKVSPDTVKALSELTVEELKYLSKVSKVKKA